MNALLLLGCLADIRPDAVRDLGDAVDSQARGRAMLEAAAEAHGGQDAWDAHQTVTLVGVDEWPGLMGRLASPWPDPTATVRLEQRLHTFDSRAHFTDGRAQGTVWGIADWQTWEQDRDGRIRVKKNADAQFILPTMQYFVELPFRIQEAPIVTAASEETIDGQTYDRVFATWESLDANRTYDQYILYISRQTGLIEKAYFTVREINGFVTGTMHFSDFRAVDDMQLPYQMTVTFKPTDSPERYLHQIRVDSFELDTLDPSGFSLPAP